MDNMTVHNLDGITFVLALGWKKSNTNRAEKVSWLQNIIEHVKLECTGYNKSIDS